MDIPEAYTMVVDTYTLFRVSVALGLTKLPYKQWSDEILADRIARGDVGALETLYDRHAAMILGIALKITDDRALAENILQETFWRVWQRAGTYQPERGAFTSWLFRMARRLAMDADRRERS
jgi:RNA polymerase sigma-70 factor (ECF subfamily)